MKYKLNKRVRIMNYGSGAYHGAVGYVTDYDGDGGLQVRCIGISTPIWTTREHLSSAVNDLTTVGEQSGMTYREVPYMSDKDGICYHKMGCTCWYCRHWPDPNDLSAAVTGLFEGRK